jgi:hypothetical protein
MIGLPRFTSIASGELQGSATLLQLPDIPCRIAILRARDDNSGNVYLGGAGVTKPDGTTDATTGLGLDAGQDVTLYVDNLNRLWRICDNAGDDLTYLVMR